MGLYSFRGPGRWGAFFAFLLPALSGCSSSGGVSGTVYLDDKPLKGGTVVFIGTEGKPSARADIEENGSYKIPKIAAGKVKITVDTSWLNKGNQARVPKGKFPTDMPNPYNRGGKKDLSARYVEIPEDYANPDKTSLTYDVKGGSQTHDIKLSSSGGAGK
jgi:hypothetical protein